MKRARRRPATTGDRALLQRRSVRALATAQVVGAVGLAVMPSVGVLLAEQVTSSEVWAGLARTGSTLGAAVASVPLATLAASRGRRPALALGWLLAAVGALVLVVAAQRQDVVALLAGLLLTGAGSASQLQARFAATDLADPAHRGRALATVVWVGALGSVLGPNLGTPGARLAGAVGLEPLAGAFVIATAALALAAVAVLVMLRPDPLLVSQGRDPSHPAVASADPPSPAPPAGAPVGAPVGARAPRASTWAVVVPLLRTSRDTRTAFTAVISAQVVMVAIMTMTPVHLVAHGGGLTLVGITISLHVAGMYGLAPVAGALADRAGPRAGVLLGLALFAGCFALSLVGAGSAVAVTVALVLLGLGWSFTGVAGASWLSAAVPADVRPRVQGFTDAGSNAAAAAGAFLSGPAMSVLGFGGLSAAAAVVLVPLCVMLAVSARRPGTAPEAPAPLVHPGTAGGERR